MCLLLHRIRIYVIRSFILAPLDYTSRSLIAFSMKCVRYTFTRQFSYNTWISKRRNTYSCGLMHHHVHLCSRRREDSFLFLFKNKKNVSDWCNFTRSTKIYAPLQYCYTTVGLSRNTDIKTVALFSLVYSAINARVRPTTITRNENSTFSVVCLFVCILLLLIFFTRRCSASV